MIRGRRYLHVTTSRDDRRFPRLCLGQGICIHHAHRRAGGRRPDAGIGGHIGDRELVIRFDRDGLRSHIGAAAHHGQRPLLAHIWRITLICSGYLVFDAGHGIAIISRESLGGLGFIDFLAGPGVYIAAISIGIGGAGEKRLVAIALGRAEIVDGDAAGESEATHRCRDGIGGNVFHVILCGDGESSISVDRVVISQVRIGLGLYIAHIHGGSQSSCAHCCTADGAIHLLDGVVRFHRDISALAVILVEGHAIPGVGLSDGGEVHHIHRTGQACIEAAGALNGEIGQIFCILRRKLRLSCGLQSSGASYESFGVFLDIGDAYGCPGAGASGTDGQAAIAAFERGGILGGDGNAFRRRSRATRTDLPALGNIGFCFSIKDIDSHSATEGSGTGSRAGYCRIGHLGRMGRVYSYLAASVHTCPFIGISVRASFEGNSGVPKTHAGRAASGHRTGLCALGQGGISRNGCPFRCLDGSILSYIRIGLVGHESLRCSACHAGGAAGPKAISIGFGITGIFRFDAERVHILLAARAGGDLHAVTYEGSDRLIYHFYCRREAHAGGAAAATRTGGGDQLGGILGINGYILRRVYSSGALAFIFFFSDERFRIGLDVMSSRCSGAAKVPATTYRGRDGGEFFGRGGIHIHRPGILESHCIGDGAIGVTGVFLYIHRRTDAASCSDGDPAS